MKKIIFAFLVSQSVLFCNESFGVSEGDEILDVSVKVVGSNVDLKMSRKKFKSYMTDEDYRLESLVSWSAVLKGSSGEKIDEVFFKLKENRLSLIRAPIKEAAKHAKPFDQATIIFPYSKSAEKVEVYKSGELVASAQVPHKRLKK